MQYQSRPSDPHRLTRLVLLSIATLYFVAAAALAVGMTVSAWFDRNGGPGAFNFANPLFYIVVVLFTAILGATSWGFVWTARALTRRQVRHVQLGKYLAILQGVLVGIEGAGIVTGLILDPPHGRDRLIAFFACGIAALFLAVLLVTIMLLERSAKLMTQEKEDLP